MVRHALLGSSFLWLLGLVWLSAARADGVPELPAFFNRYCVSCHGDDSPAAGLHLQFDTLDGLINQIVLSASEGAAGLKRWERMHDRLTSGEMPPADAEQPPQEVRRAVVAWLGAKLHAVSLERQQREGRVALRRLNRAEFEYTLHDLLGVATPVKTLLPEDSLASGFDTVASGLDTSATHLLRFQQAAAQALQDALPLSQVVEKQTVRWSGRQWLEQRDPVNREFILKHAQLEGDAIRFFAQPNSHNCVFTPVTPQAGRYRIRARVRALSAQESIPVQVARLHLDRFAQEKLLHVVAWHDIPTETAREIDVEAMLPANEQIVLLATTPLKSTGPHLAVEWIELTGPLDGGDGWRRLYGGLPRVPLDYLADAVAGKSIPDSWQRWHPGEFAKPQHRLRLISSNPRADAERLIREFLPRAMRRPPSPAVADSYVATAFARLDRGEPLDEVLTATYIAILSSPYVFLMDAQPGPLDAYGLAERLSYFLWSSTPDDELLQAAADESLLTPAGLASQTERLLSDRRSARFVDRFTGLWLDLRLIHDMKPDARYIEYDSLLAWSMPEETRRFFTEVLQNDLPARSFFHADWSMLNQRLAQHYEIAGVQGVDFRRVALPADSHRGGLLTQAAILKLTTNSTYTSPVKRGAWVLDRLLGTPPAPPPPDVAAIEPDIRGAVTIRQQLEKHQTVATCAACHRHLDPPGLALENFDVLGGWRTRYRGPEGGGEGLERVNLQTLPGRQAWVGAAVEPGSHLADGSTFDSIDQYKQLVLRDPEKLVRNLATKLLIYGTGGSIEFADRQALDEIVAATRPKQHGFRSLIHAVIQSRVFRTK